MTHIVGGYPDLKTSEALLLEMCEAGVSFIEIQIPFSDPVADGPTIMSANQTSLENGTTPEDCFKLMKKVHSQTNVPLLFMTYFNIIHHYGVEAFCKKAKDAGAYGIICPDMPYDEEPAEKYLHHCKKNKLHAIQVISPITPDERLDKIGKIASGFVYCVGQKGTTGVRRSVDSSLGKYLKNVRRFIDLPLAVGFGISEKKHIDQVLEHAEIAVMGSKVINLLNERSSPKEIGNWLRKMLQS